MVKFSDSKEDITWTFSFINVFIITKILKSISNWLLKHSVFSFRIAITYQIWQSNKLLDWIKMHQRIMQYTSEVCNNINLLKNVEKEVLMYFQIKNSLLSNVATKSNLQRRSLSPILRMLILELKVHFLWCNFSHICTCTALESKEML